MENEKPEQPSFDVAEILDNLTDAFYSVDDQWRLTYINRKAEEQWKRSREELRGSILWDMIPDREKTVAWEMHHKAAQERVSVHWETYSPDLKVWLEVNAYPISNGGLAVYSRDITKRKRVEATLRESEERLRSFTVAGAGAVYRMSPDWSSMTELYGKGFLADTWEPNTRWLDKYIHPDDQEFVTGVIKECIRERKTFALEHRILQADGSIGWTYSKAVPRLDDQGEIIEWIGAASDITERKRMEEAIRESERKYRELVKYSPAGIYEVDFRSNRFISFNDAMCQISGYSREEMLQMSPFDFLDSQSRIKFQARIKQWLSGEEPDQNVDYKVITKDGREIYTLLNVHFTRDADGKPLGAAVISHNITERKQAEEALRASEKKYRTVVETSGEGIVMAKPQGDYLYVNQRMADMLGYSEDELLGKSSTDFSFAQEHEQFIQARAGLSKGELLQGEFKFRRRDGVALWTMYNATPVFNDAGAHVANLIMHTDITERKKAEEALRESEERQVFLLKLSDALRQPADPDEIQGVAARLLGEYLGANQIYYGETVGDDVVIRQGYGNGLLPMAGRFRYLDFGERLVAAYRAGRTVVCGNAATDPTITEEEAVITGSGFRAYIAAPLVKDGQWVAILAAHSSEPRAWTPEEVALVEEVAERTWAAVERTRTEEALRESENRARELVRELETADKNKNEFLNMLSHELRNPLASIMMSLALMEKVPPGDQRTIKAIEIAKRQGEQLTRLVDDLLDVTRITQNKVILKKVRVELNILVQQAAEDYLEQFTQKDVRLEVITTAPIFLEADKARLTQVIGNLLHNAYKFTKKGDSVQVTVSRDRKTKEAVITVQDTGVGLDPEKQTNLFKPFIQVDKTLASSSGGLGLGLCIVKGMVELHGGNVSVQSEGLGQGTQFTIRLPIKYVDEQEQELRGTRLTGHSYKILVIDDIPDIAEILSALLKHLGHEVITAVSGPEGIEIAKAFHPEVLFCDIGLPEINGYEVAKSFRNDEELKDIHLIAISGYTQAEDQERSKAAGFIEHLSKPLEISTLERILEKLPSKAGRE